ncbi:unnamed protein product [Prunus brigantina]
MPSLNETSISVCRDVKGTYVFWFLNYGIVFNRLMDSALSGVSRWTVDTSCSVVLSVVRLFFFLPFDFILLPPPYQSVVKVDGRSGDSCLLKH